MKDGRTHLAHKADHAVDLDTGAIVGVTVQDADDGGTTTSIDTLIEAAEPSTGFWLRSLDVAADSESRPPSALSKVSPTGASKP